MFECFVLWEQKVPGLCAIYFAGKLFQAVSGGSDVLSRSKWVCRGWQVSGGWDFCVCFLLDHTPPSYLPYCSWWSRQRTVFQSSSASQVKPYRSLLKSGLQGLANVRQSVSEVLTRGHRANVLGYKVTEGAQSCIRCWNSFITCSDNETRKPQLNTDATG